MAIPSLGLGTWMLRGDACTKMVRTALHLGYRHFDTAEMYGNEEAIGDAIRDAPREKLFITTKLWPEHMGEAALGACEESLQRLGTDYVDLYLLHWPRSTNDLEGTFRAFLELLRASKARHVGVANFTIRHLEEALPLAAEMGLELSTNQVEFHPLLNQEKLRAYCAEHSLHITAYSPLARGQALTHEVVRAVAEESGLTPAQVCLRWLLQKGMTVIPKAASEKHARENLGALDGKLTTEQMRRLDAIDEQRRLVNPSFAEF